MIQLCFGLMLSEKSRRVRDTVSQEPRHSVQNPHLAFSNLARHVKDCPKLSKTVLV